MAQQTRPTLTERPRPPHPLPAGERPRPSKTARRRAVEQFFIHWLVAGLAVFVRVLPLPSLRALASGVAWLLCALAPRRRRMVERNLRAVFGSALTAADRVRVRRRSAANICKTMAELLKLRWMSPDALRRQASVQGLEHLDAALARGKGVILVTAHFGNWEYEGALLSVLGYPMNVIARDANDPLTRDLINGARRSKGVRVFTRLEAPRLLRALKRNECVAILPDQHAVEGAVRVQFLGLPADAATGPAVFALRTGAPILPTFAFRQAGDHIHCRILPPLEVTQSGDRAADVLRVTQQVNDALSEQIRAHPEQWLWLHNRWRARRD